MSTNQPVKVRLRWTALEAWHYDGTWPSAEVFCTQYGAKWYEHDHAPGFGSLSLEGKPSKNIALPGEWIVIDDNGKLHVIGAETFALLFSRVEVQQPDPGPPEPEVA